MEAINPASDSGALTILSIWEILAAAFRLHGETDVCFKSEVFLPSRDLNLVLDE